MGTFYTHGRVTLLVGHILDELAALAERIAQVAIFSPPYWGLRAYGTNLQVWGAREGCEHLWVLAQGAPVISGGLTPKQTTNAGSYTGNGKEGQPRPSAWSPAQWADTGVNERKFQPAMDCTRCNAWMGELGSEPYPDCLAWARAEEPCPRCFICHMRVIFQALWRVLRDDGTIWCNIGDSFAGSGRGPGNKGLGQIDQDERQGFHSAGPVVPAGFKPKDLCLVPQRLALALQADGWYIRMDNIWDKPNPMPESIEDRPTKSHEYLWLLSKSREYFYDKDGALEPLAGALHAPGNRYRLEVQGGGRTDESYTERMEATWGNEDGRNKRSVWRIATEPSDREMCTACKTILSGAGKRRIKTREVEREVLQDGAPFAVREDGTVTGDTIKVKVKVRICPTCKAEDKWLAHYAAFPEALVTPCVRLSTSEKGQCPACGAPWARVRTRPCEACGQPVESNAQGCLSCGHKRDWRAGRAMKAEMLGNEHKPGTGAPRLPGGFVAATKPAPWKPTCQCDAGDPVPQIVLDPFTGSGTTLYVARHQGRRALGIELNEDYALLTVDRLKQDSLPF